ncbi:hypothetical protein HWV07_02145 [Natronomonas salina]|uniref:hypothetical protein n=1 Tax=Natronomonas salina TaxID=1710540 RepID=UPI0015B68F4A|nr:hypothetical protein [Natronomonas salina]QLD87901.1 hypothetical protein HWV07_02145 [Natronomonas salina]
MIEILTTVDPAVVLQMTPDPGGGMGPGPVPGENPVTQVLGSAVSAFLTTLVVGAILIAVAESYTEARMADVLEDPVESFLYGLVCLVFLILAIIVLAFTGIGLVVAIPLLLVLFLVLVIGASIAFLAIGDRLVGHDDGWLKPLVVGAAINGALALTGIGGLVSFAVGAAGFGAVLKQYLG